MPSATYVARRPGPFSSLVESAEIGGLRLEPHPPLRVLDRYYDTDDGELLRRGLALRVREQGASVVVGLRGIEERQAVPEDAPLDAAPHASASLALPGGPLADAVRHVTGGDPLRPLVTIRQYRTPRVLFDGGHELGVATFDVVIYEGLGARVASNEVEVEALPGRDPLAALAPVFHAHGLERATRSKVARGIARMPRTLGEPALLLPDERRRLEAVAVGDEPTLRRRAQVLLLDARGFRPDTIATQTGLSMARVRHWRQQFRERRLGMLDPDPAPLPRRPAPRPAAPRPAEPSADRGTPPPRPPEPPPPADPAPPTEGDGLPIPDDPIGAADMASLLDLFSPTATETPLFGADAADEATDLLAPSDPEPEAPPAAPGRSTERSAPVEPYPVVLGPLGPPGEAPPADPPADPLADPFETVDLGAILQQVLPGEPASPAPPPVGEEATREAPPLPDDTDRPVRAPSAPVPPAARDGRDRVADGELPVDRPTFSGGTPLLRAAEETLAYHVALFDARASRFVLTRAPSDARRLLVAAHGLRLAAETFEAVLPAEAARRLVAALRPLVVDLDGAVQSAQAAATSGRADLARRAAASVAQAADRLARGGLDAWGDRARRLLGRLAGQAEAGALRSDDAPLADDYVGPVGSAPTATRLRHVLASAVWARFEALRAFEDDLGTPTDELAAHLAVALSALHFVIGLTDGVGDAPLAALGTALEAAERAVVRARRQRLLGEEEAPALAALAEVWGAITSADVRIRIGALTASI